MRQEEQGCHGYSHIEGGDTQKVTVRGVQLEVVNGAEAALGPENR